MAIDAFSQPMLSLGGEYFFKDDVSISAEAGLKYTERLRSNSSVDFVEDRSHSFRMELKWYNIASLTGNGRINEYVGLEARFLRHQFTDDINYTISDGDIFYARNEDFIVQKKVNVFNIKYGLNFPIGKRLYFDLYTGFGIRYKTIKNPNRYYDPAKHLNYDDEDGFLFWPNTNNLEEEGKQKLFNFSLGFKFGVKL
jgi:putative salt-induced outer membrane protein YdiY